MSVQYEPSEIRDITRACLHAEHVEIPDRVPPLLEPNLSLRPIDEIRKRALCIFATLVAVHSKSRERQVLSHAWLVKHKLVGLLARREQAYFDACLNDKPADRRVRLELTHHVEALWALAWLDGHIVTLDNTDQVDDSLVEYFPSIIDDEDPDFYWKEASTRPDLEIITALDYLYCLNWWMVEERINSRTARWPSPEFSIRWRRHALEWALSREKWDEISLDT